MTINELAMIESETERVSRHLIDALRGASKWPMYTYSNNNRRGDGTLYMSEETMRVIFRRALQQATEYNEIS